MTEREPNSAEDISLPPATRRGVFAALAAVAALAGLRPTPAKAGVDATLIGGSTPQIGLAATPGTSSPIIPTLGATNHGVIGSSSSVATATLDSGVFGARSGSGRTGVLGVNAGNGAGVSGFSPTAPGVYGESTSGFGSHGKSQSSYGLRGDSQSSTAVAAVTQATGIPALIATSTSATNKQAARFIGNVRVDGNFAVTGAKAAAVPTPDGRLVTVYCQEAPEPFFEDFGRARLTDGVAKVAIDPAFAMLVRADDLMVFITPEGDTAGLYVHAKEASGFEVRETRGGTGSLDFSWRLVAKRKDISGERFAPQDDLPEIALDLQEGFDVAAFKTRLPPEIAG